MFYHAYDRWYCTWQVTIGNVVTGSSFVVCTPSTMPILAILVAWLSSAVLKFCYCFLAITKTVQQGLHKYLSCTYILCACSEHIICNTSNIDFGDHLSCMPEVLHDTFELQHESH